MSNCIRKLITLFLVFLLAAALSSCAKEAEETAPAESEAAAMQTVTRYTTETDKIREENISIRIWDEQNGEMLAFCNEKIGEAIPEELLEDPSYIHDGTYDVYGNSLCFVQEDGEIRRLEKYQPLPAPENEEEKAEFQAWCRPRAARFGENGEILVMESSYERWYNLTQEEFEKTADTARFFESRDRYFLRVLNRDGSEKSSVELLFPFPDHEGLNCGNFIYVGDGLSAISRGEQILVFDRNGSVRMEVSAPFPVQHLCAVDGERFAVVFQGEDTGYWSSVNVKEQAVSAAVPLPPGAYGFVRGAEKDSLFFVRGMDLFTLKLSDGSCEKRTSLLSLHIDPAQLGWLKEKEDGTFVMLRYSIGGLRDPQTAELLKAVPQEVEMESGQIITVGFLHLSGTLRQAILAFESRQDDLFLQPIDYSNFASSEYPHAGRELLLTDCLNQMGPDIVVLNDLPFASFAEAGLLADLLPLVEKDPDIHPDDYFDSVWNALKTDESLFRLCAAFSVETLACFENRIAGWESADFSALQSIRAGLPADGRLFASYYPSGRLLRELLTVSLGKEDDLTEESLQQMLSLSAELPYRYDAGDFLSSEIESEEKKLYDGRQLYLKASVASTDDLKWYDAYFSNEAAFPGWPVPGDSGSLACVEDCLAITAFCDNPEEAWEFVRILLDPDYEQQCYGIPLNREAAERQIREDEEAVLYQMTEEGEYETNDDGEKIESPRIVWYSPEWREHGVYSLKEEQAEKYLALIASVSAVEGENESRVERIAAAADPFLAGRAGLKETISSMMAAS